MTACPHCDHEAGSGAFCGSCGRPVAAGEESTASLYDLDWRTGTAERPKVTGAATTPATASDEDATRPPAQANPADERSPWAAPPEQARTPPPSSVPPAARFPLYADDTDQGRPVREAARAAPREEAMVLPGVGALSPAVVTTAEDARGRRSVVPWVAGAVIVLLFAGVGSVLLLQGLSGGDTSSSASDAVPAATPTDGTTTPTQAPTRPVLPSATATATGKPTDVVSGAQVDAPDTAEPGVDVAGDPVSFAATNMLDGRPDTAWRTPGDATGDTITVTLAEPTVVSGVGMINGYAKSDPGYDGYTANRRVTAVDWTFDDGTTVSQSLGDSRSLQITDVPDVETSTIEVTLRAVSAPGQTDGRNFTAISDLSVVGTTKKR